MKRISRIINSRCLGVLALYVNMIVFLLTDYSLWYFFAVTICIGIFVWAMSRRERSTK